MLVTPWPEMEHVAISSCKRSRERGFLTSRVEERKTKGHCKWFLVNQPTRCAILIKWEVEYVTEIQRLISAVHSRGSQPTVYAGCLLSLSLVLIQYCLGT